LTPCNASSFPTRSFQLLFSVLSQRHISRLSGVSLSYFPSCPSFSTTHSCAPNVSFYWLRS
jgi:hypothetical protein